MFEDALMESGGRIRTQRGWFSGVAALCNGSVLCLLVLWPLLHPASLPRQTLSMLLTAPAPPAAPMPQTPQVVNVATHLRTLVDPFTPPRVIPNQIRESKDAPPTIQTGLAPFANESDGGSLTGLDASIGTGTPPLVRVAPRTKMAISSGVMAGNKLSGVDPQYPAIARAARIQGTVVLAATISKMGIIENLRVVSGPPMLAPAAEAAVRTWRYRPYRLNGEPVEVETTVSVIFNLGGG